MKKYLFFLLAAYTFTACTNDAQKMGHSTPIDSTNMNGTAPATYGGKNPADDTLPKTNVDDTATKANTVHNPGDRH